MVVGSEKCWRRTRALARALPGGNLQLAVRVLIRRMPEERRRPALRRFTEAVDRIARNFKQRKRRRLRTVLIPLETPRIGLICHVSPQLLPELRDKKLNSPQAHCPGTVGSDCVVEFPAGRSSAHRKQQEQGPSSSFGLVIWSTCWSRPVAGRNLIPRSTTGGTSAILRVLGTGTGTGALIYV